MENTSRHESSPQRTFDQNMNNKHTSSNTIHLAQCYRHLPDAFVHEKNFKNFTSRHETTRMYEDDEESERSFHGNENKNNN